MAATAQPKIVRKIEIVEGGGHHGGGWKVAYADFMTAMMAFFLLMWILSSADEQKLRGIAEYFTDASMPGGIGLLDGATFGPAGTLNASNGQIVANGAKIGLIEEQTPSSASAAAKIREPKSESQKLDQRAQSAQNAKNTPATSQLDHDQLRDTLSEDAHHLDERKFAALEKDVLQAIQENPDLAPLLKNIIFEKTPDGLLIQIVDQENRPMFVSGRADMQSATKELLSNLGLSLAKLPNKMVLSGHTEFSALSGR